MPSSDDAVVTLRDVFEEQRRAGELLAGLKATLEGLATAKVDHEERIRSVERWVYAIPASLVTAVASAVFAFMGRH